jgi:hypothetical protein
MNKEYWTVPATTQGWYIGNDEDGLLIKVVIEDNSLARQIVKMLNDGTLKLKEDSE